MRLAKNGEKCRKPLEGGRHITHCLHDKGIHNTQQRLIEMAIKESSTSQYPCKVYNAEINQLNLYPDLSNYAGIQESNKGNFAKRADIMVLETDLPQNLLYWTECQSANYAAQNAKKI